MFPINSDLKQKKEKKVEILKQNHALDPSSVFQTFWLFVINNLYITRVVIRLMYQF